MSFIGHIPTCSECYHANEYIPIWIYPYGDPRCEVHHKNIDPNDFACESFRRVNVKGIVKFKQKYFEQIKNGVKTQTMRMPHKRIDVKPGDMVIALFPNGEELLLRITKVGYKAFKSINDIDAKMEGFTSADELKQELLDIYHIYKIEDYNRFYYYQFKLGEDK